MKTKFHYLLLVGLVLAGASELVAQTPTAVVRFRLEGLTVSGTQTINADRMAAKVQRTQWLTFTLGGAGVAPWTVTPNNAVVRVEKLTETQFKVTPLAEGVSTLTVMDSRGGGKYVDVTVTPDRYGPDTTLFNNNNGGAVQSGPTGVTQFTAPVGWKVSQLQTYHYNNGRGQTPGTITLKNADGRVYGPFATTRNGTFWVARPNVAIAPGTYTVVDSDPATWSWNAESRGGFIIIVGGPRLPN